MGRNVTLVSWIFLCLIAGWRQFTKHDSVQRQLHKLGHLAPALQWYTLFFVGLGLILLYSLFEFLQLYYQSMERAVVNDNLFSVFGWNCDLPSLGASVDSPPIQDFVCVEKLNGNKTFTQFRDELEIPQWLRWLSLASQFAGVAVYLIAASHIWVKFLMVSVNHIRHSKKTTMFPWQVPRRINWVLFIMAMPIVFSIMTMRATCRLWALMLGTAEGCLDTEWRKLEAIKFAMYTSDMEVASIFQFSTVYAFARLCGSYLTHGMHLDGENERSGQEYRHIVRTAGFLGVWLFVGVGMISCVFEFCLAEFKVSQTSGGVVTQLVDKVARHVSTAFTTLTIICVLNMLIICRSSIITHHLGNANIRMLLLVRDIQFKVIDAFIVGSTLHSMVEEKFNSIDLGIEWVRLNHFRAHLLNLSILNLECLYVVIFNWFAWHNLDVEKAGMLEESLSNYPWCMSQEERVDWKQCCVGAGGNSSDSDNNSDAGSAEPDISDASVYTGAAKGDALLLPSPNRGPSGRAAAAKGAGWPDIQQFQRGIQFATRQAHLQAPRPTYARLQPARAPPPFLHRPWPPPDHYS
eukprot:CAMPEP_0179358508 /NCGR_PEP_ID=MMETSP0797-20121207/78965_1 /TAXON_ID=47934 /ORGANISM="Dinophysis acuminata, Strain DAEP01" /LENGTH=575 /DNA_ID=CAMNT_0021073769 /DNA_START=26 /DNA_END=1753 /DNA_ORIENTATION=-